MGHVTISLVVEDRYSDEDATESATNQLETELLEAGLAQSVSRITKALPIGAKSAEAVTAGALLLTVLPVAIPALVEYVKTWTTVHAGQTVKVAVKRGEDSTSLEIPAGSVSQDQLDTLLRLVSDVQRT